MSKPLPIFAHMPWNIKKDIIDSADTQTKFSIRRCSKELKTITNKVPIHYSSLLFDWGFNEGSIRIERFVTSGRDKRSAVEFIEQRREFIRSKAYPGERLMKFDRTKKVRKGSFIDAAIEQFVKLLRCPNTSLGDLNIKLSNVENNRQGQVRKEEIFRKLVTALGTLECKIQTKGLWMDNQQNHEDILQFLPFLSPETFKEFCLTRDRSHCINIDLAEISTTEHWKQARTLTMNNYYMTLPREAIEHFSTASYHLETFTVDDAEYIISNFLRPNGWKSRWIDCDSNNYNALVQCISKMNNVKKFKDDDSMMFGISKEEFKCRVIVAEDYNRIVFEECSEHRCYRGYREI